MDDGETITLTREELDRIRVGPADIAQGMRLYREMEKQEEASQSAQERLVLGAVGSWVKRRWKLATTLTTIVLAITGGAWKGWQWVQREAEQQVLERQAAEKQASAVEKNTEAVGKLTSKQDEFTKRVGGLEEKVDAQSQINEILLELQLRDPRTRRTIRNDDDLKKRVEEITGTEVK